MNVCPHCGADLKRGAISCRACGADARAGWTEDGWQAGPDAPAGYGEDDFDYDDFIERELGGGKPSRATRSRRKLRFFWGVMLAVFLLPLLIGFLLLLAR